MKAANTDFNRVVESVYNLPLEYKEELMDLLGHNIADVRREEIYNGYKAAQKEHKAGTLKFSSSIKELKKMF
jgi:hypothetical protein